MPRNCRGICALACLLTLFLAACGGGGGGTGGGTTPGTPSGPAPSNASGLWTGTWSGAGAAVGYQGLTVVEVHQTGSSIAGYATIPFLNLANTAITGTVQGSAISFGDVNHVIKYDGTFTGLTSASGTYHETRYGTDGRWSMTQMMTPFDDTAPAHPVQGIWSNFLTSTMGNGQFQGPLEVSQAVNDLQGPAMSFINQGGIIHGRAIGTKAWLVYEPGLGATQLTVFAGTVDSAYALSGNYVVYDVSTTPLLVDRGTWDASLSILLAGAIPSNMVSNVAMLNGPTAVAADASGNLFVADTQNSTIRQITPTGAVTTLAGTAGAFGNVNGIGAAARFDHPTGVAADTFGNVYVADRQNQSLRKIVVSTGEVTTFMSEEYYAPDGVAVDTFGNVYVVSRTSYTVRKITPSGAMTTLVGTDNVTGRALTLDTSGNIYVADAINHIILRITSLGAVTTLAGTAGQSGSDDGTGAAARFNVPTGVAVDASGNIYVADSQNNSIRKITAAGVVTTILDLGTSPEGVAVDASGNLFFVVDSAVLKSKP